MANLLELILQAKDNASAAVKNLKGNIEGLSGSTGSQRGIFTSLGETVGKYKALVAGAAAALGVAAIVSNVKEAVDFIFPACYLLRDACGTARLGVARLGVARQGRVRRGITRG